jgi:hypothetical protein
VKKMAAAVARLRNTGIFIRESHPQLRPGPRTVISELVAICIETKRIRSLHPGAIIIGMQVHGEYAYARCSGTSAVFKCHIDELVAYSRPLNLAIYNAESNGQPIQYRENLAAHKASHQRRKSTAKSTQRVAEISHLYP